MPTLAGNVIRGTASYNAAAGTSPTAITLPRTINAAKSVVFYTQRGGETTQFRDHREFFGYELTNTTLQFLRTTATSAATMNLSYEVVEFADATSVQHIVQEITSTQTDITISAVDMNRSAVFVLGARTDQDDIRGGTVRLESSTNVRVNCNTAPGAGDLILYIAVVQFDTDVSVQRGVVSLGSGNTTASGTVNIEEIDPTRSVVIGGGQNDLNQYLKRMAVSWSIVDGETIAWNRAVYGSQVSKILPWQVITLANGFSRHGSYEITDGNTTPTTQPSFTALDPTKSSLVVGFPLNECRPTVDITSAGMLGGANYRATIVPTVDFDGLTITRANARSGTSMAGTFAAFQWEGGEPTEETPPKDVAVINIGPGSTSVSGDLTASPGGSAVGTSLRYCITESDTPPSDESEDWIDLDWDDLPYPVTFKGSRGLYLHAYTIGSLDPSSVVTYPFTSPNLRIVGPASNVPVPLDGFETGEVDSAGLEPGAAGRIDWRADGNTVGEDVSIVVNAPSEDPPENITPPTVTGTFRVGGVAYAGTGEWTGNPTSYTYQWVIDDEDVSGATNPSYEFQAGDLGLSGYCRVTATNAHGTSEPVNTASFGPIEEAIEGGNFVVDTNSLPPAFETITTDTGVYSVHETYADAEFRVWVWTHNTNTTWRGVMVTRAPETGKTNGAYSRVTYPLMTATIDSTPIKFRICEGSNPLIWQNEECVAPTMQRIRDAIDAKEVLPYDTDWIPGTMNVSSTPSLVAVGYIPDRMFDRTSAYDRIFGGISGAAGEGPSSRGFLSEFDSALIMAAVKDDETAWDKYVNICSVQARYAMTLANTAVWSRNHRQLRDPGIPFSGDRAFVSSGTNWGSFDVYPLTGVRYEIEPDEEYLGTLGVFQADITDVSSGTPAVISYTKRAGSVDPTNGNEIVIRDVGGASALNGNVYYIRNRNLTNGTFNISLTSSGALVDGASLGAYISGGIASHYGGVGRDPQHMFNHGYAYWLATKNPVYAISQMALWQSILAFRYQGAASGGNYIPAISMTSGAVERQTMNIFALMLRAKLIRDGITVANDTIFWSTTRMNKMVEDIFTSWSTQLAARDAQYTSNAAAAFTKWAHDVDGGATSVFMTVHYGPETAYMWALHGHPELMERWAGHAIVKFNYAGGQLGADPGLKPDTRETGWVIERSIPVSNDPAELPYDDSVSLGAYWITVGTANGKSNTSFTTGFNYIQQAYGGILKAKQLQDAGLIGDTGILADLAATVTKMETHIGNSTWNSTEITAKHCSTLFEEVE